MVLALALLSLSAGAYLSRLKSTYHFEHEMTNHMHEKSLGTELPG